MGRLLTQDIIRVTNQMVDQSMTAALKDFNSRVLPDDRIDNISDYFNDKRQHTQYPKLQNMLFIKFSYSIISS